MGYSRSETWSRVDAQAHRERLGPGVALSPVSRAMPPDCLESADLPATIERARELGVDGIESSTCGLVPLSGLDWVRSAPAGAA
jgi:hypothetical protein